MYTILEKRVLAENIYLMRIHAPRVARAAKPGQFIIVRIDEFGERVPLTISDYDAEQGSVTIVTQAIGASTRKLCALEQGDALLIPPATGHKLFNIGDEDALISWSCAPHP